MILYAHLSEGMVPNPNCLICDGKGEVWKYYKEESEKVVHQPYAYCPACFPDKYVAMGEEEWVEISFDEANDLVVNHGYVWD